MNMQQPPNIRMHRTGARLLAEQSDCCQSLIFALAFILGTELHDFYQICPIHHQRSRRLKRMETIAAYETQVRYEPALWLPVFYPSASSPKIISLLSLVL